MNMSIQVMCIGMNMILLILYVLLIQFIPRQL